MANLPAGGDLGCNPDVLPSCVIGVTATDNCDGDLIVDCTPGEITGDDCNKTQVFNYYAVDECGNDVSENVAYTWKIDLTDPVLANLPAGGDLSCNPDVFPSCDIGVTATDNCDGDLIVGCTPGEITGDDCNKTQVFNYYAVDECGNDVSEDITYTWKVDLTDPVLANLPAGGDLGCNPDVLPSCDIGVTATDNCDGDLIVDCYTW